LTNSGRGYAAIRVSHEPWLDPAPTSIGLRPGQTEVLQLRVKPPHGQLGRCQAVIELQVAFAPTLTIPVEIWVGLIAPDGSRLESLAALAVWCRRHWAAAVAWSCDKSLNGLEAQLADWPSAEPAPALRRLLRRSGRAPHDGDTLLDQLLALLDPLGYGAGPLQIAAIPSQLRLDPTGAHPTQLQLINSGGRYLQARLRCPGWLTADGRRELPLNLPPGATQSLSLQIDPSRVPLGPWRHANLHIGVAADMPLLTLPVMAPSPPPGALRRRLLGVLAEATTVMIGLLPLLLLPVLLPLAVYLVASLSSLGVPELVEVAVALLVLPVLIAGSIPLMDGSPPLLERLLRRPLEWLRTFCRRNGTP
jgi:hypothetical protein